MREHVDFDFEVHQRGRSGGKSRDVIGSRDSEKLCEMTRTNPSDEEPRLWQELSGCSQEHFQHTKIVHA